MLNYLNKISTREKVLREIKPWQQKGMKIGFTSGAFDLIHPGHVEYLNLAKASCDKLVIGLNSDESIRKYKSADRPIISEDARAQVLAGLECVDLIFIFDELNNKTNIEILKPDVYIKAGDYDEAKLTSAPLVKSYGGSIEIIKFKSGFSTSKIIEEVLIKSANAFMIAPVQVSYEKRPAVFLDRDGTLVEHVDYLHEVEKVKCYTEGFPALKKLQDLGYRMIMVTNQPGIGLGYFTKEDFFKVNLEIFHQASKFGLTFDKVYYSPYGKGDKTNCRKPETGMLDRAVSELNIDLERSFVVGDSTVDIQLAKNAGVKSVLVKTGNAGKDGVVSAQADYIAEDLKEVADFILKNMYGQLN